MLSAVTTTWAAEAGRAVPAPAVDAGAFREAMGSFPTGVTVVTVASDDGNMHGITVNSFSSVSLDPMLVLVCLNETSRGVGLIERAGAFAVNVLSAGQQDISRWFANRYRPPGSTMFDGVPFAPGLTGCPVLVDATASFDCRLRQSHRAGDHLIMLGEVVALVHRPQLEPLIFHAGSYKSLEHEPGLRPSQAGHGNQRRQPARNRHPDRPTTGARRPVKGSERKLAASQPPPEQTGRGPLAGH
jgi:flavin reductase (DIM6/NTAB) family NADH-FMN oxidoreductase RutF